MPTVQTNDIHLYYEEHGEGEPLLLIMGWGGNASTWTPQITGLTDHVRVISFDNRGVGRSSAPDEPYTTCQMAADTLGLLDALEVSSAHIFGVSLGGMIAQELAIRHPERVRSLVLGCTSPGGPQASGAEKLQAGVSELQEVVSNGIPDVEWFSEFMKLLWTEEALSRSESSLQDFVLSLIRYPPTPQGLRNQALAAVAHDAFDRLSAIRCPTLVMTGAEDELIPPRNSGILADHIPNAELRAFPGLRHAFHLEAADQVNSLIVNFIKRTAALPEESERTQ